MTRRNRHIGKQLREALRASRWDAGTLARRAYVSRTDMARALVGDTALSLHTYELVAEQLELNLEFDSWRAAGQPPAPSSSTETVVDRALQCVKIRKLTDLSGILRPPTGIGHVSLDDLGK